MAINDYVLYRLAKEWPSPVSRRAKAFGAEPGMDTYHTRYAWDQFDRKVRMGIQFAVSNKDVLEIGCGHGGISCFLATAGATSVVGIDVNEQNLVYAERFSKMIARRFGDNSRLPLEFQVMDATNMSFPGESFDLVVADNAFEHFTDPECVLKESKRVLRPNGSLLVPIFSSIYSRAGLHLKHGLKLPWANIVFSEAAIVRAMHRLASENSMLYEIYPGLTDCPARVRDLRRYKDLNDITYKRFRRLARRTGFDIEWFRPFPTRFLRIPIGRLVAATPILRDSIIMDVLSTGASACLRKAKLA